VLKILLPIALMTLAAAAYSLSHRRKLEFEVEMKIEPKDGGEAPEIEVELPASKENGSAAEDQE
jgi:hypothetical protein